MGKIFIITGGKAEGKTSFTEKLIELLQGEYDFYISGFLSKGYWKKNRRSHYELVNISNGQTHLLCKAGKIPGWIGGGPYSFNPATIKKGEEFIEEDAHNCQLIILDEIGKLELNNKIWHPLLIRLLENLKANLLLVIRKDFVKQLTDKYKLKNVHILNISETTPQAATKLITGSISQGS